MKDEQRTCSTGALAIPFVLALYLSLYSIDVFVVVGT
jgi:hypothetical protein